MYSRFSSLLLVLSMLVCLSCVDDGQVTIFLVKSSDLAREPLTEALTSYIRVRVTGPDMSPKETVTPYRRGGSVDVPGIPQGRNRVITVDGLGSEDGTALSRGRSLPVDIDGGKQRLTIFIARTERFSDAPGNGLKEALFGHIVVEDGNGMLIVASGATAGNPEAPESFSKKPMVVNPMDMSVRRFQCDDCLLTARAFGVAAPADHGFWLVGGRGADGALSRTIDFVDVENETVRVADLKLLSRSDMAGVIFDDKTVIAGGIDDTGNVRDEIEILSRDGTVATARLPHPRYALAAGRAGKQGVFFGGYDDGGSVSGDVDVYDAERDSISSLDAGVTPRAYAATVNLSDGRLLLLGGLDQDMSAAGDIDIYDPAVGAVCNVGQLALARWFPATALLPDGRVLVVGGLTGAFPGQPTRAAHVLNLRTTKVTPGCTEPNTGVSVETIEFASIRRYLATATVVKNGNIVLIGGFSGSDKPLQQMEVYVPSDD